MLSAEISAQPRDADSESDDTILVEGDRELDGSEVRNRARQITIPPSSLGEPLARFQQPICVGVWGASPTGAEIIIDRIYQNIELIGLEIDTEPGCRANVLVGFTPDPQADFAALRKADDFMTRGLGFWEAKRVSEQLGPVVAWNVTTVRTRDGILLMGGDHRDPECVPVCNYLNGAGFSRLNTSVRLDIEGSVVLIDSDEVAGKDIFALADYATMRSLARISPPDEASYGTILALFNEDVVAPQRLTEFDVAYLRSLYRGRNNIPANMALTGIDDLMEEEAARRRGN